MYKSISMYSEQMAEVRKMEKKLFLTKYMDEAIRCRMHYFKAFESGNEVEMYENYKTLKGYYEEIVA